MKRPKRVSMFSKALLSGVLTGLAATIVNIVYNVIFRSLTRYMPDEEFNFLSITFASMIVLTIIGMLFFVFVKNFNKTAFVATIIIIVIACICISAFVHANTGEAALYGNHGLIAGFVFISGLLAITLLPYLYNHPKIFI